MAKTDLYLGECIQVCQEHIPTNSIDTIITDPPAGISFMARGWDDLSNHEPKTGRAKEIAPLLQQMIVLGLLQKWEAGFLLFTVDWATEALRVIKPGGMALVWSIPRTGDLAQIGLRMAGWEIRDKVAHIFGSGFPKSANISKAIDKAAGAKGKIVGKERARGGNNFDAFRSGEGRRDRPPSHRAKEMDIVVPESDLAQLWDGWGTSLKPSREDWILAMAPREGTFAQNAERWGVAGLWIDGSRVPTNGEQLQRPARQGLGVSGGWANYVQEPGMYGTPHGVGRWPANLILDEQAGALLDMQSGTLKSGTCPDGFAGEYKAEVYGKYAQNLIRPETVYADQGGASRFFYCPKAAPWERNLGLDLFPEETVNDGRQTPIDNPFQRGETPRKNTHPTVKPIALMRYLVRLTKTPTGGTVLDMFMGSGSTGCACVLEDRDFIGIEVDPESYAIAEARIAYVKEYGLKRMIKKEKEVLQARKEENIEQPKMF